MGLSEGRGFKRFFVETGARLVFLTFFDGVVPDYEVKVIPNEKTYHPTLKDHILSFNPSKTRTVPTWIKAGTDRPSRAMPVIVR